MLWSACRFLDQEHVLQIVYVEWELAQGRTQQLLLQLFAGTSAHVCLLKYLDCLLALRVVDLP
jgi:hypothetical protein